MSDLSRVEQLLRNALGEDIYEVTPQSRVEALLVELNELIEGLDASVDPEAIAGIVTGWLAENIHDGAVVDSSLSVAGAAAESKKVGDEISDLKEGLTSILSRLINKTASKGDVLTYDSTVSDSKPYPWSWAPAPVGTTLIPISSNDSAGIYYVVSQLKAAADNSGVASMSVPFEAGQAFLSNIYGIYQNNKTPIIVVQGASPNPIMRYLAINNLWAESLETGISGAEMGYWDGLYHIEIVIGTSTLTIIVEKKG